MPGETGVSDDFQSAPVAPWLSAWGFVRHPFMTLEAGQDEFLADHFVPHPGYFEQIARNPIAVVLAPTGSGKTANRLMLVSRNFGSDSYLVTTRTGFPVAPLFSWPLLLDTLSQSVLHFAEKHPEQFLSLPEWRREALHRFVLDRLGGVALDEYIARWSQAAGNDSIRRFVTPEDALAPLVRLACDFARRQPRRFEPDQPETIWELGRGHLETGGASCAAVLVDLENITESPVVRAYLDKTCLHAMGDCFWLFAPLECAQVVRDSWAYQEGHLATITLDWPKARLIELLRQRLRAASREYIDSLRDIAQGVSSAPDDELVEAALHLNLGAPLAVLRLAQTVFDSRIQNFVQDGSLLLTEADWQPVRAARRGASLIVAHVNPSPVSLVLVHRISSPFLQSAPGGYDSTKLFEILVEYFDEEELRTLCFKLNIDYDSLRGEGKAGKARELILYMERQGPILDLLKACKKERPNAPWRNVVLGD